MFRTSITLLTLLTPMAFAEVSDLPRATAGPAASLPPDPKLEVVARLPGPMPAGVAIAPAGRTFLSFPMWGDPHQHSLMELHKDGSLAPFPVDQRAFSSVQGLDCPDDTHLYALDAGRAQLHLLNLSTHQLEKTYTIPPDILGKGSYLNDVRVDPARQVAYVSDSARGGLLILNLDNNHAFRRLTGHPSSHPAPGITLTVEGEPLRTAGNTDGIALSPDRATLYYSAFANRTIYSIPTADLLNESLPDSELSPTKLTDKPSANDGLATDPAGNVYSTDYEDHAIRLTTPAGQTRILVQDPRLLWPDALWAHGNYLYITTNQLNRMPAFHKGKDLRQQPYVLYRYPLSSPQ